MDMTKYNDTADYQHICILGRDGAYTPTNISAESLPDGFYKYTLIPGDASMFQGLTSHTIAQAAGSFITREPVKFPDTGTLLLCDADWSFPDKDFVFEDFYGTKLSLDLQVEQATAKRDALREEKRSKHQGKELDHSEPDKELQP